MTTELTKAAQHALEALEYMHKEKCDYMIRNKLGDPLKEDAARLAIPAMDALRRALTQRPAAQTEREANATARAFSLATMGAEEFVRCNGLPTGNSDEFLMTGPDLTDEHATACVDHLKWVGECVAFDTDDGVLVRLGDFTLGSLS